MNCSIASQVISRVKGEAASRARITISAPAATALTTAAPTQSARYDDSCSAGSRIQTA